MERLFMLDAKDYDEGMPEISRTAVRAVISIEDELLCIEDKTGGVKLPGGGQEDGEDDLTTLAREIREETGHALIPSSVVPFGYVEEKRLTVEGDRIWHHTSRIYFCEVSSERTETSLSEQEKSCGMHFGMYTIEDAVERNRRLLGAEGAYAWARREYETMLRIKDHMERTGGHI